MTGTESISLRDITTKIGSGATPLGGKESYKTEGITLIRSQNVYDLHFEYDGLAFIDEDQAANLSNVEVNADDILLNITGASVARCCIVPPEILPARVNQHTAIIRINKTRAVPRYVLYCLVSPYYKHHLLTLAQGGATREALTKNTIEKFMIRDLPLHSQRKIAAILSAYDDLIENNTRRIKILEEMAQALYREWFVNFRFPGHEKFKMVDSPLGMIPEGWEAVTVSDISSYINRGISPKYNDDSEYIVINQKCIRDRKINLDLSRRHLSKVPNEKYIQFGDILINSTGVGTLGRVAQVYQKLSNFTVDSHVSIVRPKNNVTIDYFGLSLLNQQDHFESLGTGSTGQSELNRDSIAKSDFLLPPISLQLRFTSIVEPMRKSIIIMLSKNNNLRCTRDLLLPTLISGELNVDSIDIKTEAMTS